MFSAKQHMKKYFLLILMVFSTVSFAQFQNNVFEKDKTATGPSSESDSHSASALKDDEDDGGFGQPGTPGEPPAPIDDYIPWLLFAGMSIIIYSQRKNKKVNI